VSKANLPQEDGRRRFLKSTLIMEMLAIVLSSAVILTIAYFTYGRLLSRLFRLDDKTPTPAITLRDDVDYVPCETGPLLSQHFSAIAAAGPIVGPILAGVYFGWLPALLWILVGSILIGGVHDFAALVASIRHRATSIIEVVRIHISGRAYLLFLAFVWLALVYIVVAFTDITASMFVGALNLKSGQTYSSIADARADESVDQGALVQSGGVATSSLLYLVLPIIMGLLVRSGRLSMGKATWIFLPLVGAAIWIGPYIPFNVDEVLRTWMPALSPKDAALYAVRSWDVFLLVYCAIASVAPMWLLLQPRGQLGGYFLYAALGAGALGIMMGGQSIQQPAFTGWTHPVQGGLFPILFITIACGACSGFHSLICSGTTSKQLQSEGNARPIGYGAMLLEAMVAIVSLCCVMMLPVGSSLTKASPNFIYANGIGAFLEGIGVSRTLGVAFALMAFNTFVYDTLDVCTRLGRFIIQELTGWKTAAGRWFGTLLTAGVPIFFVMRQTLDAKGNAIPVWKTFWSLFGASNQLLAALTLLGATVWLWRTRRAIWVFFVTGLPAAFMYVMSSWALMSIVRSKFTKGDAYDPTVAWIAVVLLVLAALMLLEGIAALIRRDDPPATALLPVQA
jgi:carbon starvation protein